MDPELTSAICPLTCTVDPGAMLAVSGVRPWTKPGVTVSKKLAVAAGSLRDVAMTWTCTWSRESNDGGVYRPLALIVPWPRAASFCPEATLHFTLAEPPEPILAVNWSVVAVSIAALSALMTRPPAPDPAAELTAPQPARSRSENGAASNRSCTRDLRMVAPNSPRFRAVLS